ncbi:uncharacterized protein TNCV_120301 [Trichonephila clavipes]|nr:uncharacterized protein TNCV_120301 [Trichonephila clavipes]
MVWGAISYVSRSILVVIPNILIANLYVILVIQPIVLSFINSHQGGIFQLDNAHPHTNVVSQRAPQSINMLPLPAGSPDPSSDDNIQLPTLRCRRVAGVSPLLSIGWWYIYSVSPKRHCCRVSAADKRCRVYPLDPRTDAVALCSGCTPGKRRAWFCQMPGTLSPLLDSVVGGGTPG